MSSRIARTLHRSSLAIRPAVPGCLFCARALDRSTIEVNRNSGLWAAAAVRLHPKPPHLTEKLPGQRAGARVAKCAAGMAQQAQTVGQRHTDRGRGRHCGSGGACRQHAEVEPGERAYGRRMAVGQRHHQVESALAQRFGCAVTPQLPQCRPKFVASKRKASLKLFTQPGKAAALQDRERWLRLRPRWLLKPTDWTGPDRRPLSLQDVLGPLQVAKGLSAERRRTFTPSQSSRAAPKESLAEHTHPHRPRERRCHRIDCAVAVLAGWLAGWQSQAVEAPDVFAAKNASRVAPARRPGGIPLRAGALKTCPVRPVQTPVASGLCCRHVAIRGGDCPPVKGQTSAPTDSRSDIG